MTETPAIPSAFVKSVAGFDIEGWLSGASLPEQSVTVYGAGKLVARLQALQEAYDDAQRADAAIDEGDESMTHGSEALRIARQMESLRKDLRASKLTLRLRALLPTEREETKKKAKTDDDFAYAALAIQCVEPTLTADHFKSMRGKIGEGQFNAIMAAANEASYGQTVDAPFSLSVSALLAGQDS